MGKGDARTKRGKIFRGSFGNSRPQNPNSASATARRQGNAGARAAARTGTAAPRGRGKR